METIKSDYLIIGTGLSGLYSAMQASRYGTVTLISKSRLTESNSYYAQGGVAAAVMPDDSTDFHYEDTIKTGRGLCKSESVRILVDEGKERIEELIALGMPFDTNNDKHLAAGLEGGHSKRRVLHAGGDSTGREIVNFMRSIIAGNKKIKVYENIFIFDLIVADNICRGAYGFIPPEGKSIAFTSRNTIMAAGGLSALYGRTTNPPSAVGDGIALAYLNGAELANMEMLQFHPTCFFPGKGNGFLISEAVRGEGAHLVNEDGIRFMTAIDPMGELAPRDLVAISIFNQMKKYSTDHVYLKLDHLNPDAIKKRFSNIYKEVSKSGIDITKDLLPVAPAAHYTIGGIKTDLWGRTNIENLYAVGEAASNGVHGANRLASNSLLECLVYGTRAVKASLNNNIHDADYIPAERNFSIDRSLENSFLIKKERIEKTLNSNAGIVRTEKSLLKAVDDLNEIETNGGDEYFAARLRMFKEIGLLIASSALLRRETRGVHIREDYPNEKKEMVAEIVQKINSEIKILPLN